MMKLTFELIAISSLLLFSCSKEEPAITKEVFNGDWKGLSYVDLFHENGEFFRDSKHSITLELFYGGQGNLKRTSGTKDILWVAESNPDLFIYSEEISGQLGSLDLYLTYIYQIVSYSETNLKFFKEDTYTENGVQYLRQTTWELEKLD